MLVIFVINVNTLHIYTAADAVVGDELVEFEVDGDDDDEEY